VKDADEIVVMKAAVSSNVDNHETLLAWAAITQSASTQLLEEEIQVSE
jgi:hypothetical protein